MRVNSIKKDKPQRHTDIETNEPADKQTHRLPENQNTDKETYKQKDTQVSRARMYQMDGLNEFQNTFASFYGRAINIEIVNINQRVTEC